MKKKGLLRLIGALMLAIAIVFVICAMSAPTLGSAIIIGDLHIGAEAWRMCYALYAIVMVALLVASFFVKN